MPDREKVIKGLHDARRYLEDKEWSDENASPHIDAINEALVLLKEQDAVEPHKVIKGWKDYLHEAFIGAWTPIPKKYQ